MKIAQISTLSSTVGRNSEGSVEKLAWGLSRHLIALGQEVTVFGVPGDSEEVPITSLFSSPYATADTLDNWHLCEWINICEAVKRSADFDILHSHSYLNALPLTPLSRAPILSTLHIWPYADDFKLVHLYPRAPISALSHAQWRGTPRFPVIPHGVEREEFPRSTSPEDYVLYLGRFIPEKGAVEAIQLAKRLGVRLLLAGYENEYLNSVVRPLLVPGESEYVGPVTAKERAQLLSKAKALLYPLLAPEPFGLVVVEAMMCGTPVIAPAIGAVPELVIDGESGILGSSLEELAERGRDAFSLNREAIATYAETRFSMKSMARSYLELYRKILEGE